MNRTRIKICCIQSPAEVELAVRYGADAVGLVSGMPSGPGPIEEEVIRESALRTPPGVASFLLTSLVEADGIIEQQRRTGANTLQLVDAVEPAVRERIKRELPGIGIVQVIHVEGEEALGQAIEAARTSDAVLLDSGSPGAEVKVLGGTGRVHDWSLSRRIRDSIAVPLFLAGGLNPGNIEEAIAAVEPYGVDICTGIRRETDYMLDEQKLHDYVRAVQTADLKRRGAAAGPS
jgi:phosphoribosylanthranilate isomerase